MTDPTRKSLSRVWILDGGAGPAATNRPQYVAQAAAGAAEKNYGDVTRIEVPSSTKRGEFDVIGEFQSGEENATLGLMLRYMVNPSLIKKVADKRCIADIQVHIGACTSPTDFDRGWQSGKVLIFERGRIVTYSTEELGTLQSDDENPVNEEVEISANEFYEVGPMAYAERAASAVAQEIIKIVVCDTPNCGDCDDPSDGCQKVFAVSAPAGSSPGVLPEVISSDDGFDTIASEMPITTLAIGEDPDDAACVGDNLVVVSQDSLSLHYADKEDLLDGVATWTEVSSGFVATHGPRAIDNFSVFDTYIVGAGGYVYYTEDPTSGVEVLDAGVATTEDLNDVDVLSADIMVAVGANNAVVYTINGTTIQSVTGPAVGVVLNAVAIRSEKEWWVGAANGSLYYTLDQGAHWAEKTFPGSGTGAIEDIVWASSSVGFVSHTLSGAGRVLRTISGGNRWYVAPEAPATLSGGDRLNSLAVCLKEVNILYAAGLAGNAADGIILKGSTNYI